MHRYYMERGSSDSGLSFGEGPTCVHPVGPLPFPLGSDSSDALEHHRESDPEGLGPITKVSVYAGSPLKNFLFHEKIASSSE